MNKPVQKKNKPVSPKQSKGTLGDSHSNTRQLVHLVENYSGPLPHPVILERFDQVIPNGAERIMTMVEEEQRHRQALEKEMVEQDGKEAVAGRKAERRGQFLAAGVCIGLLIVARDVALAGYPVYATIIAGGTLTGIITAFVSRNLKGATPKSPTSKQE